MIVTDGDRLFKVKSLEQIEARTGEPVYTREDLPIEVLRDVLGDRAAAALLELANILDPARTVPIVADEVVAVWRVLNPKEFIKIRGRVVLVREIEERRDYGLIARLIDGEWR